MATRFPFSITLSAVDRLTAPLAKLEGRLNKIGGASTKIGKRLTRNLTAPILAFGALAVSNTAQFEASSNRVRALTGAQGAAFEQLTDQAKTLGRTTVFAASEAAESQGNLALSGFKVNEILGATPGVLELASAGALELGRASEIAAGVLRGQRFEVDQLSRVNNVLAKAQARSATTVEQLGDAYTDVGSISRGLGQQFEVTTAALGKLGDNMFRGERGGTALKGILATLANLTPAARAELAKLGIQRSDLFDTAGNLRQLTDILEVLEEHGFSTANAFSIFGKRAGPGLVALLGAGSKSVRELAHELEFSAGFAAEQAAIRMEGASGAVAGLRSAFEGLQIAVVESGLLEWFTSAVQRLTAWIQKTAEASPQTLQLGVKIAAITAVAGPALLAIGSLATGLGLMTQGVKLLLVGLAKYAPLLLSKVIPATWAFTAALLANPVFQIVAGVTALVVAVVALWKNWDRVSAAVGRAVSAVRRFLGLSSETEVGAEGTPIGAERVASVAAGGRPDGFFEERRMTRNTVSLDFRNVPRGTQVRSDGELEDVDLSLGFAMEGV